MTRQVCGYCGVSLRSPACAWYLRCATCTDMDLCRHCFSVGAALPPHESNHPYCFIVSKGLPAVYEEGWGAEDERNLLLALEKFGIFAWDAIADFVGSQKSKFKCEAHYHTVYLDSESAPLPDVHTVLPKQTTSTPVPTPTAKSHISQEKSMPPWARDIEGFQTNRGDFDIELYDDAEASIADLAILPKDPQNIVDLKVRLIQIYNAKVEKRTRAKHVLKNHTSLLTPPENRASTPKEELLLPLAQILSAEEYSELSSAYSREQNLMDLIRSTLSTPTPVSGNESHHVPLAPLAAHSFSHAGHLSDDERAICSLLRLEPERFIQVRDSLVQIASQEVDQLSNPEQDSHVTLKVKLLSNSHEGADITVSREQ